MEDLEERAVAAGREMARMFCANGNAEVQMTREEFEQVLAFAWAEGVKETVGDLALSPAEGLRAGILSLADGGARR